MIYNLFYTLFLDLPIYPKIIWHSFNILKTFISEQKLRNKALRSFSVARAAAAQRVRDTYTYVVEFFGGGRGPTAGSDVR